MQQKHWESVILYSDKALNFESDAPHRLLQSFTKGIESCGDFKRNL